MPKVWWNHDEKIAVGTKYLEARAAGKSKLDALKEGMSVLPPERRRTLTVNWRINFRKFFKEVEASGTPVDTTLVVPQVIQIEVPVQPSVEQVVARLSTGMLIANLCERFFGWVHAVTTAYLTQQGKPSITLTETPVASYEQGTQGLPTLPPLKRPAVPKIAIVGLLKEQFNRVQEKINNKATLLFVDKDWAKTDYPSRVDYICVTRHVQHRWTEVAKATLPRERIHWVTGETDLVQTLYDITSQL